MSLPVGSGSGGGASAPILPATVLGAPAAVISATPIPQTYRNLLVVYGKLQSSTLSVNTGLTVTFNGDTTIGHYGEGISPSGASVGFGNAGIISTIPGTASGIQQVGGGYFYVFNYTDPSNQICCMGVSGGRIGNAGTGADFLTPATWNGLFVNGPITRIDLTPGAGNLLAGGYLEVFGLS